MCEEQIECPLCMEVLDIDDINFKPCTCGYQICRFCWHRIRTDENGLCPACRKPYPENPAEFKPLTDDDVGRIKKERKQRDQQRKQKAAENRKHLANVRVVQRNLVFVVGLSARLADPEVLKKHEYFGKYGRIHKVVINQSTSYAGAQGPSASAYVTYKSPEDALRAILAVNNVQADGRTLKASLGTTKYCSHFLRGSQCPKGDCMYLHELGEEAASFTKEEMQMGKHQEYEQKLIEEYINTQNLDKNHLSSNTKITAASNRKKCSSPVSIPPLVQQQAVIRQDSPSPKSLPAVDEGKLTQNGSKDWPSLGSGNNGGSNGENGGNKSEHLLNGLHPSPPVTTQIHNSETLQSRVIGNVRQNTSVESELQSRLLPSDKSPELPDSPTPSRGLSTQNSVPSPISPAPPFLAPTPRPTQPQFPVTKASQVPSVQPLPSHVIQPQPIGSNRRLQFDNGINSLSLFSDKIYPSHVLTSSSQHMQTDLPPAVPSTDLSKQNAHNSFTDWPPSLSYPSSKDDDDDLEFDPCNESFKGLADLIEKENGSNNHRNQHQLVNSICSNLPPHIPQHMPSVHTPHSLPPGFSLNHLHQQQQQSFYGRPDFVATCQPQFTRRPYHHIGDGFQSRSPMTTVPHPSQDHTQLSEQKEFFHAKDMQDQLRSLLPNINISFGALSQSVPPVSSSQLHNLSAHKGWPKSTRHHDPAIVSSGNVADGMMDPHPHWLDSIHQLTENDTSVPKHRPQFVPHFPVDSRGWPSTYNPPPGFQLPNRLPPQPHPEMQQISEGLQ